MSNSVSWPKTEDNLSIKTYTWLRLSNLIKFNHLVENVLRINRRKLNNVKLFAPQTKPRDSEIIFKRSVGTFVLVVALISYNSYDFRLI